LVIERWQESDSGIGGAGEMSDAWLAIAGDTIRSLELRHEVPVSVLDPLLYLEDGDSRVVVVPTIDTAKFEHFDGLAVMPFDAFGELELVRSGMSLAEMFLEVAARACDVLEVGDLVTPGGFPLDLARRLERAGRTVRPDRVLFDGRRRVKTPAELAGIKAAIVGAERAISEVQTRLLRGGTPTSEELRRAIVATCTGAGVTPHMVVIASHGWQTAIAHHVGEGAIKQGEPIVVDVTCMDPVTGCWADITRTFCLGDAPEELHRYQELCVTALDIAVSAIAPGVATATPNALVSELFEAEGLETKRTRSPGGELRGFFHNLGHGVGLDVHEPPSIGTEDSVFVEGDVIALEPGLYRPGFGGYRLEDMFVVTETGCERLTSLPRALTA
jgi:Xaa-Pro aminopeptidase